MKCAYRIGGIGLEISGLSRPRLRDGKHWPLFRARIIGRGGIGWRFHGMGRGWLKRPALFPEEIPIVARSLHWGSATPLLGAPPLRRRLAFFEGRPSRIAVESYPSTVTLLDFTNRRADVYFVDPFPPVSSDRARGAEPVLGSGLLAPFLPERGAFLAHAAAVAAGSSVKAPKAGVAIQTKAGSSARGGRGEKRAKAALFLAPDEGGKTTAARLAAASINGAAAGSGSKTGRDDADRSLIIGDDQILLRRERGKFWVHGTPWNLICAGPAKAELGGIFLLEKGDSFKIAPLRASDAVAFIWNEHRHITDFVPAAVRKKAFDLIADACASVPVYRLTFTKDRLDWIAVSACLK